MKNEKKNIQGSWNWIFRDQCWLWSSLFQSRQWEASTIRVTEQVWRSHITENSTSQAVIQIMVIIIDISEGPMTEQGDVSSRGSAWVYMLSSEFWGVLLIFAGVWVHFQGQTKHLVIVYLSEGRGIKMMVPKVFNANIPGPPVDNSQSFRTEHFS